MLRSSGIARAISPVPVRRVVFALSLASSSSDLMRFASCSSPLSGQWRMYGLGVAAATAEVTGVERVAAAALGAGAGAGDGVRVATGSIGMSVIIALTAGGADVVEDDAVGEGVLGLSKSGTKILIHSRRYFSSETMDLTQSSSMTLLARSTMSSSVSEI